MNKKVFIKTFGCQMNEYDSEKINDVLKAKDKEQMKEIEEVRRKINTFSSKVKYAPHGASKFFSDNQIK